VPHEYRKCLIDVVSYPTDRLDIYIGIMLYIKSMTEIWSIHLNVLHSIIQSCQITSSFHLLNKGLIQSTICQMSSN
jgi:hypothetical protein